MPLPTQKKLLLAPADVTPSQEDLEVIGVFNPGTAELNGEVHLLVRVAERPKEKRPGCTGFPRWESGRVVIDWLADEDHIFLDSRVCRHRETGLTRLTFASHLRVVNCGAGETVKHVEQTVFAPHDDCDEFGVEDPRITRIDDRFYFTYVAVSRHGAATALASTADFREFARLGIILPPENKDAVLFPDRFRGQFCALHRPTGATPFTTPEMWIAWSHDLESWGNHEPLLIAAGRPWSSARVGAGAPPIRVDDGWLLIYHGSRRSDTPGRVGQYVAAALLLDANQPSRIIAESTDALFVPTEPFEREGFVPEVVFPTGVVRHDDTLLVYYGASDTFVGVAKLSLSATLKTLGAPS
jgi:beta-1,2-mannobiose phosphorylase / 1,2-beta-oligomannan phosphorylase